MSLRTTWAGSTDGTRHKITRLVARNHVLRTREALTIYLASNSILHWRSKPTFFMTALAYRQPPLSLYFLFWHILYINWLSDIFFTSEVVQVVDMAPCFFFFLLRGCWGVGGLCGGVGSSGRHPSLVLWWQAPQHFQSRGLLIDIPGLPLLGIQCTLPASVKEATHFYRALW